MNFILSLPMDVRLVIVFLLGTFLGGFANWGIYRFAWIPRPISPWSFPASAAPPRPFWCRLPIVGWLGLRREASLHGRGFWIRPMMVELFSGLGLASLYWWEVHGGLLPVACRGPLPPDVLAVVHMQFAAHAVLLAWMLIASMIDADEMLIPDAITVSGTLIGLLIAAVCPWSLLPDIVFLPRNLAPVGHGFLQLASPNEWPAALLGSPQAASLLLGLACWWAWCAAILPRTWYSRHGWRRALRLSLARVQREPSTYRILRMGVMGSLAIAMVWYRNDAGWQGLLTALVGMSVGGGLIWAVRIVGAAVMRREAMGFGDVTLMAMIGAFVGWQPSLIIFFLAPLAGIFLGILRMILFRDREIPYGPFLCLASLFLIVEWDALWENTQVLFEIGWFMPVVMAVCLVLMGAMLGLWRLIVGLFR